MHIFYVSRWYITIAIILSLEACTSMVNAESTTSYVNRTCNDWVEANMRSQTDYKKWEISAANVLLTLLPALLMFSPLPTAHLSALMALNPPAALVTCGMMLFLPVQSTWPSHQVLKARNLRSDGIISSYGIVSRHEGLRHVQIQGIRALHTWYTPGTEDSSLLDLQRRVLRPKQRFTMYGVVSWTIIFLIVQYGLCFVLIAASQVLSVIFPWDCSAGGMGISNFMLPFWCLILFVVSMAVYGFAAMKNKDFQEVILLTPLVAGVLAEECACCSVGNRLPQWKRSQRQGQSLFNKFSSLIAL